MTKNSDNLAKCYVLPKIETPTDDAVREAVERLSELCRTRKSPPNWSDISVLIQAATRPVPGESTWTQKQVDAVLENALRPVIEERDKAIANAVPEEPTGPMLMAGIHVLERSEDVENVGTGPLAKMVYQHMVRAFKNGKM